MKSKFLKDYTIVIDNGKTFEGDVDQFKNCFFTNPTFENIKEWCKNNKMKVEFVMKEVKK
jgi:hypothetical protein